MGERTATTVDPEALADAILADLPAAQARTTSSTREHLEGLSPELAERLEAGGSRVGARWSDDASIDIGRGAPDLAAAVVPRSDSRWSTTGRTPTATHTAPGVGE